MTPRYVRFARALALVTGSSAVACGGVIVPSDSNDASPDADGAAHDTLLRGTCRHVQRGPVPPGYDAANPDNEISCGAGGTCVLSDTGAPQCQPPTFDAGWSQRCGVVSCAQSCSCFDSTISTCDCVLPIEGPLPPPDLAAA